MELRRGNHRLGAHWQIPAGRVPHARLKPPPIQASGHLAGRGAGGAARLTGFDPGAWRRCGVAHTSRNGCAIPVRSEAGWDATASDSRVFGIRAVHAPPRTPGCARATAMCKAPLPSQPTSLFQPPCRPARPCASGTRPVPNIDTAPRRRLRELSCPAAETRRSGRRAHAPPGVPGRVPPWRRI